MQKPHDIFLGFENPSSYEVSEGLVVCMCLFEEEDIFQP